jgi:WD40 repeat protein
MQFFFWMVLALSPLQKEPAAAPQEPEGIVRRFGTARYRHAEPLTALALSHGGHLVATGDSKTVKIWESATGRELHQLKIAGRALAFSKDDAHLAVGGTEIAIVTCATGDFSAALKGHAGPVLDLKFSPDARFLASASDDVTARVWDLKDGSEKLKFEDHLNTVFAVAWSPDGATLATASRDDTIRLWSMPAGTPLRTLTGHGDDVRSIAFTPDGTHLVSAGGDERLAVGEEDRAIRIWNLAKEANPTRVEGHLKTVQSLAFSKDGTVLASGDLAGQVRFMEWPSGRFLRAFNAGSPIKALAITPDGKRIAVATNAQAPQFWEVATGAAVPELDGHLGAVTFLVVTPDGGRLLAGDSSGPILIWDVKEGKVVQRLAGHSNGANRIAVSRDGRRAASMGRDRMMRVWNLEDGAELAKAPVEYEHSSIVAWWPDDETVVFQPQRHELRLFSVKEGRALSRTMEGPKGMAGACFLGDGKSVALSDYTRSVRIWNFDTGAFREAVTSARQVYYLGFSEDRRYLAAGGEGLVLLDLTNGKTATVPNLEGLSRPVFSRDGRRLAYPRWDRPGLAIVEVASGQMIMSYPVQIARTYPIAILHDGWTVAAGLTDTTIGFWNFAPDEKAATGKTPDALWKDMAEGTASEALEAVGALAVRGSVSFLKDRMRPKPDVKEIGKFIGELRSDDAEAQKKAAEALGALGGEAENAIEAALAAETDKDKKARLQQALDYDREPVVKSASLLRRLRAQEALERIGSKDCVALLKSLSESAVSWRERAEAAEAVKRLERGPK